MKTLGLYLLTLFVIATARAELDTLWTRTIELPDLFVNFDAAVLLSSGEVLAASAGANAGEINLWSFDVLGEQNWTGTTTYDGLGYMTVRALEQYQDGQIALLTSYWSEADSANMLHIRRLNRNGEVLGDDAYQIFVEYYGESRGVCATGNNHLLYYTSLIDSFGNPTDLLIKFNSLGDTVWTRRIFPDRVSRSGAVAELENGDLILAGSLGNDDFSSNGFIMRTNAAGDSIWARHYPTAGFGQLAPQSIGFDQQGNIYCAGYDGFPWWGSFPWAVSLTPDGAHRWTLSGFDENFFSIYGIRVLADGSSMVLGSAMSDFGPSYLLIHTLDANGNGNPVPEYTQISEQLRGLHSNHLGSVAYGGGYGVGGMSYGKLFRFGLATTVTGFVRAQGTNQPVQGARVELVETEDFALTDAQGIYFMGVSQASGTIRVTSPCITPHEEFVTLTEGEENIRNFTVGIPQYDNAVSSINLVATFGMWERDTLTIYNDGNGALHFGTAAVQNMPTNYSWLYVEPVSGVIAPNSSAEIVVSILANPDFPDAEFFGRVEVHHNSCPDTVDEVGVYVLALDTPERTETVSSYVMHPAYPNPFNSTARVAFDIPQSAHVTAKLYSIEGREVATLANEVMQPGAHELTFEGDALATGFYLLRFSAGNFTATQKLVLLK